MWDGVMHRETGGLRPSSFARRVQSRRLSTLQLSNRKEIVSAHRAAVNSLQVDITELRYLLSGASDGSAAVYDIQRASDCDAGSLIARHRSLFVVDKQHERGHKFAISSVFWYPVDTGLFITGSFDHYVKVWDTNMTQVVMDFKMPGKVHAVSLSSIATTHMLIATGSADVQVRLCDIASGAFTHTLSGHRDGIMAVEWSASSEWVLVTGGCDGAIRFWDIRRAGCFLVLDQSQNQLGRRPPFLESSFGKKSGTASAADRKQYTKSVMFHKRTLGKGTKKMSGLGGGHQPKSSRSQRLHPGMTSTQNLATSHYGAVTGLKTTGDGMYLLSSGSDSRLRLWDIESGCNTLVNFEAMRLQTSKALQLAISHDSSLVFVPCMMSIKAFDMWSGSLIHTLRGHYELVNCCYFSSRDQELYTGSNDRQILVWSPSIPVLSEKDEFGQMGQVFSSDRDYWSD